MRSFIYFVIIITTACLSFWFIDLKSKEVQSEIEQSSIRTKYQKPEKILEAVNLIGLKANDVITSPITIKGDVAGKWFFEGVIGVKILDGSGVVLGQGPLNAEGDWMVEKNVRFSGPLTFMNSKTKQGCIVIEADDPSGLGKIAPFGLPVVFQDVVLECDIGECGTDGTDTKISKISPGCPHNMSKSGIITTTTN